MSRIDRFLAVFSTIVLVAALVLTLARGAGCV